MGVLAPCSAMVHREQFAVCYAGSPQDRASSRDLCGGNPGQVLLPVHIAIEVEFEHDVLHN